MLGNLLAHHGPIHFGTLWNLHLFTPLFLKHLNGVLWKNTAVPFRTTIRGVGAAFIGQIAGCFVSVVTNRLHEFVVKLDCSFGSKGYILDKECVLQAHNPKPNRTVATVGCFRSLGRIEIHINHIIEGTDRNPDGVPEFFVINFTILGKVGIEHHRTEVTNGCFILSGIQGDLGAKVGTVNDPGMILRTAYITGILEGDPWVAGFKKHLEHGFPKINRWHTVPPDLTFFCLGFVLDIFFLKCVSVKVVQVWHFITPEKSPVFTGFHPLHEQVRNPVGRVHVMGPATIIPGVLTKLQKLKDIAMPGFQIGTT